MRSALVRIETDHSVIERPESGAVCFDSHLSQLRSLVITVGFRLRQSGSREFADIFSSGSSLWLLFVAKKAFFAGQLFCAGPTRTAS